MKLHGPFYEFYLNSMLARTSNYTHYKLWDEITYPFPNFNNAKFENGSVISSRIILDMWLLISTGPTALHIIIIQYPHSHKMHK